MYMVLITYHSNDDVCIINVLYLPTLTVYCIMEFVMWWISDFNIAVPNTILDGNLSIVRFYLPNYHGNDTLYRAQP